MILSLNHKTYVVSTHGRFAATQQWISGILN